VLAYAALILGLSSIPARSMPESPGLWRWDKLIHACEYAGFAFLLRRAAGGGSARRWQLAVLVVVAAACFGVLDELYQSTTAGRDSSGYDALADFLGACFGSAAWTVFYYRRRRAQSSRRE
jgi:VanZ family protein